MTQLEQDLLALIAECREYVEKFADVVDSDDGEDLSPRPNAAMKLLQEIDSLTQ